MNQDNQVCERCGQSGHEYNGEWNTPCPAPIVTEVEWKDRFIMDWHARQCQKNDYADSTECTCGVLAFISQVSKDRYAEGIRRASKLVNDLWRKDADHSEASVYADVIVKLAKLEEDVKK
jgi:hypothetical protein